MYYANPRKPSALLRDSEEEACYLRVEPYGHDGRIKDIERLTCTDAVLVRAKARGLTGKDAAVLRAKARALALCLKHELEAVRRTDSPALARSQERTSNRTVDCAPDTNADLQH